MRKFRSLFLKSISIVFATLAVFSVGHTQTFAGFEPQAVDGFFLDGYWVNGSQGTRKPNLVYGNFLPTDDVPLYMVDGHQQFAYSFFQTQQTDGSVDREIYRLKKQSWNSAGLGVLLTIRSLKLSSTDTLYGLVASHGFDFEIYQNVSSASSSQPVFRTLKAASTGLDSVQVAPVDLTDNGEDDLLLLEWLYTEPALYVVKRPSTGWQDLATANLDLIPIALPETLANGQYSAKLVDFSRNGTNYVLVDIKGTRKIYEIDYSGVAQDPNGIAQLVTTADQAWFQNVANVAGQDYCFFSGSVDGVTGDYLVVLKPDGVPLLYKFNTGTNRYELLRDQFLYADFGALTSPSFGKFYDGPSGPRNRLALAYNNSANVTKVRFFDVDIVTAGVDPVVKLTSIPEGTGDTPVVVTGGEYRTGPMEVWSENRDNYESIFYSTFQTREAFLENTLSQVTGGSNTLSAADFVKVNAGLSDGDSYGSFEGNRGAETQVVVRFADLDFDGDVDATMKGNESGYHFYKNMQVENGLSAPSFVLQSTSLDPFADYTGHFINVDFVDLDGNSFYDLVYTLSNTPTFDPTEQAAMGLLKVVWNSGIHPYEDGQILFSGTGSSLGLDVTEGLYYNTYFAFGDMDQDLWEDLAVGYGQGGLNFWLNQQSVDTEPPASATVVTNSDFTATTKNANLIRLSWYPMSDATMPGNIGTGIVKYRITRYERETDVSGSPLSSSYSKSVNQIQFDVPAKLEVSDTTAIEYHQYIYVLQAQDAAGNWSLPSSLPGTIQDAGDLGAGAIVTEAQTYGPILVLSVEVDNASVPTYTDENWQVGLNLVYTYTEPGDVSSEIEVVKVTGPSNVLLRFQSGSGPVDSWVVDGIDPVNIPLLVELTDGQPPAEGSILEFQFRTKTQDPVVSSQTYSVELDMIAPAVPSGNATAELVDPGSLFSKAMRVSWSAFTEAGSGIDSYTVTRQLGVYNQSSGLYEFSNDEVFTGLSISDSPYTDNSSSIDYGKVYRYVITAADNVGNVSDAFVSNAVETPENLTEPPSPAPNITSSEPGDGFIRLRWQQSEPRATGATSVWYRVFRQNNIDLQWTQIADNISETSYTDYGDVGQDQLPPGNYQYYIQAFDNLDNVTDGSPSNWITITGQTQKTLDYIEVGGPSRIDESSSAQYTCTAFYTDSTSETVTYDCTWSENSSYSVITGTGYLTASSVTQDQSISVTATYTLDSRTRSDSMAVTIVNGGSNLPGTVSSLTVSGPTYNPDGTASIFTDWYPTTNADMYVLERSLNGGDFLPISDEIQLTGYEHIVSQSGTYEYRIKGINSAGYMSEEWTYGNRTITVELGGGPTELAAPTGVMAVSEGPTIRVSWDPLSQPGDYTSLSVYQVLEEEGPFGTTSEYYEVESGLGPTQTTVVVPNQHDGEPFVNGETYGFALKGFAPDSVESDYSETATVSFSGSNLDVYTISASAGEGGTIDPNGDVQVVEGSNQIFVVTPDAGKEVTEALVDGQPVELEIADGAFGGAVLQYTFESVTANHTISVSFDNCEDTEDPMPPTMPYVNRAGSGYVELRFQPAMDVGCSGIAEYLLYRAGVDDPVDTFASTILIDEGVSEGEVVTYYIRSKDAAGNLSDPSELVTFAVPEEDNAPPSWPVELSAKLDMSTTLSVDLSWKLAIDDGDPDVASGVSVYEIYRSDSAPVGETDPDAVCRFTQWTDTDIVEGNSYTYWVRTRDMAGNTSSFSSVQIDVPLPKAKAGDYTYSTYFPHIATGADWWTGFALLNPNGEATPIVIELFGSDGSPVGTLDDYASLAAGDKIVIEFNDFDDNDQNDIPEGASWVRVRSELPLDGFELFGRPSTDQSTEEMVGVKVTQAAASKLLFPVVKVDESHWTGIAVVNTSDSSTNYMVTAIGEDGDVLAQAESDESLPSKAKTVKTVESYFVGNQLPEGTRSLILEADQPCIGFELFGTNTQTGLAGISAVALSVDETGPTLALKTKAASDAPRNLVVQSIINTVVTLSWDEPLNGQPDAYRLYTVEEPQDPFSDDLDRVDLLGEVDGTETNVALTLEPETTYQVAVCAVTGGAESTLSNAQTFTTEAAREDGSYLYVVPRVDEENGGSTEIIAMNRSNGPAEVTVFVWNLDDPYPVQTSLQIPALGSKSLTSANLALTEHAYVVEMISTEPLVVCEVFQHATKGYYDSLLAFSRGLRAPSVSHIARRTSFWDSHVTLWNESPYYNEIRMHLYDAGGELMDTSETEDSNPIVIQLSPYGRVSEEIHAFVSDDNNVRELRWIRLEPSFPINGYFDYGTKDGRKISAIELE